jgi:transcription initiation factor TFIIIB Brf1 subunit/transcription initiation factor TFIIB
MELNLYTCNNCKCTLQEQEIYCKECYSSFNRCPICYTKEVTNTDDNAAICLKCGSVFHQGIFSQTETPQIYRNEIQAICKCSSFMGYYNLIIDNCLFVILRCNNCKKQIIIKLNYGS